MMSNEAVFLTIQIILAYVAANLFVLFIYNFFDPMIKGFPKAEKDILPIIISLAAIIFIPLLLLSWFLRAMRFFSAQRG